ncbi:MAG: DHH family phosphoesterase [Coriobacteriales bacterium]|jgi:phosphoesterase RecJ-like protein|nr:DHH family phosphoesterase [Coriobacteriales bacterium]
MTDYKTILALCDGAARVAICGHINPDGDCIGSMLALREILRKRGKDPVCLLNQDQPAPQSYAFLPGYDFCYASQYTATPDLMVVVDGGVRKRLGHSVDVLDRAAQVLVIDHHDGGVDLPGTILCDPRAAACALLIWELAEAAGLAADQRIAEYCYLGLMTDTGRFAYQNTDVRALAAAAAMVKAGASPDRLAAAVYSNTPLSYLELEGRVVKRLVLPAAAGGKVAYSYVRDADLAELGLSQDQTEDLPQLLRSIAGVEVSVLFREQADGHIRGNLRSQDGFDVGAFAKGFGGGGHPGAAGISSKQPLALTMQTVSAALIEAYVQA